MKRIKYSCSHWRMYLSRRFRTWTLSVVVLATTPSNMPMVTENNINNSQTFLKRLLKEVTLGGLSVRQPLNEWRLKVNQKTSKLLSTCIQWPLVNSDHHIDWFNGCLMQDLLSWLDLTWSWFYFSTAAVCPSSWGRQQAANTSYTCSPGGSVLWIDATNAASIHVSLYTIWPCLSWSPSSFWTWNLHNGDKTWYRMKIGRRVHTI